MKRLYKNNYRRVEQFLNEVDLLSRSLNQNLLSVSGGTSRMSRDLILVYEFIANGTVADHLHGSRSAERGLTWPLRQNIAIETAEALAYLHAVEIIHRDVKTTNILLDNNFHVKVADFGLAAFVGRDFSRILTSFRGTTGYLAPEWLSGVAVTPKIDVYGFGMVLLEIISGRRNSSLETSYYTSSSSTRYQNADYFPVQAISKLHSGDVKSLVDPRVHGDFNLEEAERVCKVACWCIQDEELDRPTMGQVVQILEGLVEITMPPIPRLLQAIA